ncbi:MAG: sialidase family protein [Saprospiraceae bacterium]
METPEKPKEKKENAWKYVGPGYKKGIKLQNGRIVQPKEMTDAQIDELIESSPEAKDLFTKK